MPTARLPNATGVGLMLRSGPEAVPEPVNATPCGLPVALSAMLTDAVRDPAAFGLNVTLIAQFAPAATLVPHVFVWEKSPALVPVTATLVIVSTAPPVFVNVTACAVLVVPTAWAPKAKDVGDRLTTGPGGTGVTVSVAALTTPA